MPEQYKFYDKDGSDISDNPGAIQKLEGLRKSGRREIEGEIEKTDFHMELIRTANQIISLLFRKLKIKKDIRIDPEQVHFLHTEDYNKATDKGTRGTYSSIKGSICIDADRISDNANAISIVLHEFIHAISKQSFFYYFDDDAYTLRDARVGLRTRDSNLETQSMTGVNELLVENVVLFCLNLLHKTLKSRLGVSQGELKGKIYGGGFEHNDLLRKLFEKMSGSIDPEEFMMEILRAHFSGSLNILEKFNEFFGPNAVEVLGYLDCFYQKETDKKGNALVNEYFLSADETRKGEILQTLRQMKEYQYQKELTS